MFSAKTYSKLMPQVENSNFYWKFIHLYEKSYLQLYKSSAGHCFSRIMLSIQNVIIFRRNQYQYDTNNLLHFVCFVKLNSKSILHLRTLSFNMATFLLYFRLILQRSQHWQMVIWKSWELPHLELEEKCCWRYQVKHHISSTSKKLNTGIK